MVLLEDGRLAGLEIMDLIDELGTDTGPEAFCKVVRAIGDKAKADDSDRECFGDFEGFQAILATLKKYGGDDGFLVDSGYCMKSLCLALPGLCFKSNVNRGIIRDEGVLEMIVNFLAWSVETKNAECCMAACAGVKAACLASDGNKMAACRLAEAGIDDSRTCKLALNEPGMCDTSCEDSSVPEFKGTRKGALDLILDAMDGFKDNLKDDPEKSIEFQTAAFSALRALVIDDDPRGRGDEMLPSAVANRDYLADEAHFPRLRKHIAASFKATNAEDIRRDRLEVLLQLTKEVANHPDRINDFVMGDDMLTTVRAILSSYAKRPPAQSDVVLRSSIALLRQFSFAEELKQLITDTDTAQSVVTVLKQRTDNLAIIEQSFGLFSNLTFKKEEIVEKLNADPTRLVSIARIVLNMHRTAPGVVKTVVHTLRNASKVPEALEEMREFGVFELIRMIVIEFKDSKDTKWHSAIDSGKHFLREHREDEGIREKPKHNEYY
jgi:hypothetical protein